MRVVSGSVQFPKMTVDRGDDLRVAEWLIHVPTADDLARIAAGRCPCCGSPARTVGDWMECVRSYGAVFQLRDDDNGDPAIVYTSFLTVEQYHCAGTRHNERKRRGEIPMDDRDAVLCAS